MSISKHSCQFLLERDQGEHNLVIDTLIVILLGDSFIFDPVTHSTYSDIQAKEIPTENGYTQKSKVLDGFALSVLSDVESVKAVCSDVAWIANGGDWPGVSHFAIINNSHNNDTVILCNDFETVYEIEDGKPLKLSFKNGLYLAKIVVS